MKLIEMTALFLSLKDQSIILKFINNKNWSTPMRFRLNRVRDCLFLIFSFGFSCCMYAESCRRSKVLCKKKLNSSIEAPQRYDSEIEESNPFVFTDSKKSLQDIALYEVNNYPRFIVGDAEASENVCSYANKGEQTFPVYNGDVYGSENSAAENSKPSSIPSEHKSALEIIKIDVVKENQSTCIDNKNAHKSVNSDVVDSNSNTNTGRKKLTEVVVEVGLHNEPEYDCELLSNAEWVTLKILKDDFLPEFKGKPKFFGPVRPRSNTKAAEKIKKVLESLNCENLKRLGIRNALLADFPEEILKWKTISALDLRLNNLSLIPKAISELNQLENLDLSFNNFSEFPENVTSASSIKELNLINNRISSIPTSIKKMTNLEVLILSCNSIREISYQINNLKKLKSLIIANNKISKSLAFDLNSLSDLRVLTLSSNKELTELFLRIPEKDCKLEIINLKYCSVSSLPANFCFLPNIKQIALDVNYISEYGKGDRVGLTELSMVYDLKVLLPYFRISRISELKNYFEKSSKLNSFNNCNTWDFLKLSKLKFHIKECELNFNEAIEIMKKLYKYFSLKGSRDQETLELCLYYNGINYIMYLHNVESQKFNGLWEYYSYPQYKNTMRSILMDVLVKLDKRKEKDFLNMEIFSSILYVFKKSQSVQLAYLYFLSKFLDEEEGNAMNSAENFTMNTIAVLKDYIFSMTVNIKGYDQSAQDFWKHYFQETLGVFPQNSDFERIRDDLPEDPSNNEFCDFFIYRLAPIHQLFIGKFTPLYVCEVLSQTLEHMPRFFKEKCRGSLGSSVFETYCNYRERRDNNLEWGVFEQHGMLKLMGMVN